MKASEVLRGAFAKFEGGEKWAKEFYGFSSHAPGGGCVVGAMDCRRRELGPAHWNETCAAYAALKKAIGTLNVEEWNDAPERTFADVEAAFQKAIQLAEAEGN